MKRPTPLSVVVAGIPDALKTERRWALWRYIWKDGRWTKMQFQPFDAAAKSNDPSTWSKFADVLAAYQRGGFDGISFALGDGWVGVDIDNSGGHIVSILAALAGYHETSPSGEGFKVIGRGSRIGGQIDCATTVFTTWTSPRFFTITGQDSYGDPLIDISAFIDARFPAPTPAPADRDGYGDAALLSDDDLLLQMVGSDNGDTILTLWRGDTSAHGDDHSRADQALCCHLAFWTNYDADRVDRLFRQSGLMRPKWNTDSYRRATLAKALR